jgi:hypothetical protein
MRLTFLITTGADAVRTYVLGNGSALGTDIPPAPVAVAESFDATGVGACEVFAGLHADAVTRAAAMSQ